DEGEVSHDSLSCLPWRADRFGRRGCHLRSSPEFTELPVLFLPLRPMWSKSALSRFESRPSGRLSPLRQTVHTASTLPRRLQRARWARRRRLCPPGRSTPLPPRLVALFLNTPRRLNRPPNVGVQTSETSRDEAPASSRRSAKLRFVLPLIGQ